MRGNLTSRPPVCLGASWTLPQWQPVRLWATHPWNGFHQAWCRPKKLEKKPVLGHAVALAWWISSPFAVTRCHTQRTFRRAGACRHRDTTIYCGVVDGCRSSFEAWSTHEIVEGSWEFWDFVKHFSDFIIFFLADCRAHLQASCTATKGIRVIGRASSQWVVWPACRSLAVWDKPMARTLIRNQGSGKEAGFLGMHCLISSRSDVWNVLNTTISDWTS